MNLQIAENVNTHEIIVYHLLLISVCKYDPLLHLKLKKVLNREETTNPIF